MNKDLVRQIANALAVIATITMNILANALPLNGQNTGDISDRFQVLFVPAGYVFAIWG
jgi:benzodiazapine receptor